MIYESLESSLIDLEKSGHLIRIKEEVDPYLEMAAIHLRVHEAGGPALLFEKVKGTSYPCASNIFGTLERSKFLFRKQLASIQELIEARNNPAKALKKPLRNLKLGLSALKALPKKINDSALHYFDEIKISNLPLIKHWPMDGGAFITLPQVYSEDVNHPGIMQSNLGMYRIQLNGNNYELDNEIGLHYQLHRGIGVHQSKANSKGQSLKVSIFVGGPPSHTLAAVMPLPEGISELMFAGALGGRRFRYTYSDGYCISLDADFVITGEVGIGENKPEGPFGDHLGYYSLKHDFPLMRIHRVYARKKAIWPFTVVGRPPQEDTAFGQLIHEITGSALTKEIPGLKEVNAVDAAGVHPLLLAIGSERYTPYLAIKQPSELLTIANHLLGTGQLSLAKFLFITADERNQLSTKNIQEYFHYLLSRIDKKRDIHFYTNTSIDTLDYSGTGLNLGSKVVFAAYGDVIRELGKEVTSDWNDLKTISNVRLVIPGVLAFQTKPYCDSNETHNEIHMLNEEYNSKQINGEPFPLLILCDDSDFVSATLNNFLWVSFTRCNPSHDIHGIKSFTTNKHWGCDGPMIIDARKKPHHAPELIKDAEVEKRIDRLFVRGGSLYGVL